MTTNHRRNTYILMFALVVVTLGFGMVIPIFPFYLERMGAGGSEFGFLIALYAIMQLVCGPMWGGLSDRVGRKPVLVVGMLGNALTLVLFGLATQLWMLFMARALSGLLSSAMAPAATAYVGDCTDEEDRGDAIGKLGGAMALGVILGPGIGGWLAGDALGTPFFVAAALSLVGLALIVVFVPESLARNAATETQPFTIGHGFRDFRRALTGPIGPLLLMAALVSFGATMFQAIFGLYALVKFDFNPQQVGTILVVAGLVSALMQGLLTGPVTKRWGEPLAIKVFLITNGVGFLILLMAGTYATVLLTAGIYSLSHALLRPTVTALTSKRAEMGQGVAMGFNSSAISLGQIIGPIFAGIVFDINPNLPYVSGALIMFVGFVLSLFWITPADDVPASGGLTPA